MNNYSSILKIVVVSILILIAFNVIEIRKILESNLVVIESNTVLLEGEVTAYTSSVDETDDRPWETAAGTVAREGVAACPSRYPFGTKIEIRGRTYICEDRMAKKYRDANHFDIWVETKELAFEFGRKQLLVALSTP